MLIDKPINLKVDEARFILGSGHLGRRKMKWEIPADLRKLNKGDKYSTIIGIGRWRNRKEDIFVCISQGKELIYIEKKLWLQVAGVLPLK